MIVFTARNVYTDPGIYAILYSTGFRYKFKTIFSDPGNICQMSAYNKLVQAHRERTGNHMDEIDYLRPASRRSLKSVGETTLCL